MRETSLGEVVKRAVAALDVERVRREYWEQNEFVFLERFLPPAIVTERLVPQVLHGARRPHRLPLRHLLLQGCPLHGPPGAGAAFRGLPALFVALVLVFAGVLTLEFGISTAITEIVAGVLLALFVDVSTMDWLVFLSQFGMLGLIFMAGFEGDPAVLRRSWRPSLGIGVVSFLLPAAGLYAVCRWGFGIRPDVAGLLAIGLSTTSLALVYHFLRERDLPEGESGQTILGAAMVVDVLSMIGLAVLLGNLGWASAIFLIAAVPVYWGLPRFGEWVVARSRGSVVEFEVRFLLMLVVGLGFLAEHAGIHAAIVSFAAGLVLGEVIQDHEAVEGKRKGVVFSFFAPVFFLRAGTQPVARPAGRAPRRGAVQLPAPLRHHHGDRRPRRGAARPAPLLGGLARSACQRGAADDPAAGRADGARPVIRLPRAASPHGGGLLPPPGPPASPWRNPPLTKPAGRSRVCAVRGSAGSASETELTTPRGPTSRGVFGWPGHGGRAFPAGRRPRQTRKGATQMAQGQVKWFSDSKGYGFIQQDSGEDVFVHHTAIQAEGFRSLAEGDKVEFEVVRGPKGFQATNVRKI